jgi:prepilin-type processing-associated H-X9-DG protein
MPEFVQRLEGRRMLADVTGLVLINAQTDQAVPGFQLIDGAVIDLATAGRQLNIRADVSGLAGSVRFNYDGNPGYKIENSALYAIGGNSGDDFAPWTPTLGTHSLVVTAYPQSGGAGARGVSKTVVFQVVDSSPAARSAVRVNAGGGVYNSTTGQIFAADSGFSGGVKSFSNYAVGNTLDDPLYRARRYGATFSFAKPVDNGQYTLTLHFAEPTFTAANQRKFDVKAEGVLILDDLDLVKVAGAKKAYVRSFPVSVSDGTFNLAFASSINNAITSGIELVPLGVSTKTIAVPAPIRVNAGGVATTDFFGRPFESDDAYFTGGTNVTAAVVDLYNAFEDEALLGDYRQGASFSFTKPLANGNYSVFVEFVDFDSTAAGQRLIDISAEGALRIDNLDVHSEALKLKATTFEPGEMKFAVVKSFDVNVTDGKLNLDFTGVIGEAIVSAIVAIPTDVLAAMIPYSGLGDYPNSPQREAIRAAWAVRSQSNLRRIGQAMLIWGNDHKGKNPPNLHVLVSEHYDDHSAFANPRVPTTTPRGEMSWLEQGAWVEAQDDYLMAPGVAGVFNTKFGEFDIVVYENPNTTPFDDLNALFGDGHVAVVSREKIVALFGGVAVAPPEPQRPMQTLPDPKIVPSQQNLRDFSQATRLYANDNRGRLPITRGLLFPGYNVTPEDFLSPRTTTPAPPAGLTEEELRAWIDASTDYIYLGAGRRDHRTPVVAYENPAEMSLGLNLLFGDGHVEFREMRWALETIASAKAYMAAFPF